MLISPSALPNKAYSWQVSAWFPQRPGMCVSVWAVEPFICEISHKAIIYKTLAIARTSPWIPIIHTVSFEGGHLDEKIDGEVKIQSRN